MSALVATTEWVPASVPTILKTARILDLVAIGQRAGLGVPLLIRGEAGDGKDILARLLHADSARQLHSFIKVSCGVERVGRCEVDLFGHEKEETPLSIRRRLGSFEFANHGTIYLDEIAALPCALVPKLVHLLRTGEVSRTGGREIIRLDVRVIASTRNGGESGGSDYLWQELQRLNVVEIFIPPLRQRTEEIPLFASFFLEQFNQRYRRDVQLSPEALASFMTHSWPGNIRELEEAVQRLVVGGAISLAH